MTAFQSSGTSAGTGQYVGIEILVRKSPAGLTNEIRRLAPLAAIPAICAALPRWKAAAPTMSRVLG